MRRATNLFLALLVLFSLILPAGAVTEASSVTGFATVAADGGCQISLTISLRLEDAVEDLYFPIPKEATGVRLNGSRTITSKKNDVRRVNLSKVVRNMVGDVTVNVQYSLRDVIVTTEEGALQLQLPLLSGFAHPVKKMEFSVTLPGETETLPGFYSGYHQNRIEEDILYEVNGPVISGSTVRTLKDHETLTMTMAVQESMFPRGITKSVDYQWATIAMLICGGLAALYWLLTMFNRPGFARTQPEMPQGYHAGNLGSALTGTGLDLSLMVMHWGQLGYVLIHLKGKKVFLYKQMEMGNERSETEQRWFKKVFDKGRSRVDTSERRYANLCRLAAKKQDKQTERMKIWNGNPKIFRGLAAGVGLFAGISIAVAIADGAALQGLWMVLLGALGLVSGWNMQLLGRGILLRNHRYLKIALLNAGIWQVLSLIAGAWEVGVLLLIETAVLALLLAWGGRRTAHGRIVQMQTLGFARYLQRANKADMQRLSRSDPEYFFRLAPGALALGRETVFAKRFGDVRMDGCPYLTTGMDGHMTALQWSALMRKALEKMKERENKLPFENVMRLLATIRKG